MAGQNSEIELDLIKTEERSSFVKAGKLVISNVTCSNISLTLFDFWYGALCMLWEQCFLTHFEIVIDWRMSALAFTAVRNRQGESCSLS